MKAVNISMAIWIAVLGMIIGTNMEKVFPNTKSDHPGPAALQIRSLYLSMEKESPLGRKMWERHYKTMFYKNKETKGGECVEVRVHIEDPSEELSVETDQSYQLKCSKEGITINASTIYGYNYALESLSQLIVWENSTEHYRLNGHEIEDHPAFQWRGLLLDSARHYLPVSALYKQIRGMRYNKMNVLHWHLSDLESFPFQSLSHPQLNKAAYGEGRYVYTQQEVKGIVNYAKEHGIRVVPGFPLPSHSGFWGMENLHVGTGNSTQLKAGSEETYKLLEDFFKEVGEVFPDAYVHLGGHDVNYTHWDVLDPETAAFMTKHELPDHTALVKYFWDRVIQLISPKVPIFYEELFSKSMEWEWTPPPSTVFQVLKKKEKIAEITGGGFGALMSSGWDLERQNPTGGGHYFYGDTFYDFQNNHFPQLAVGKEFLLGGESVMWGDQVDENGMDVRVWPKTLAVAAYLWSQGAGDVTIQRCVMTRRGIPTWPLRVSTPCEYPDD